MRFRRVTVSTIAISFSFLLASRDVAAQAPVHSATSASLHSAVQASHVEATTARAFVDGVLARPAIQEQFKRIGVSASALNARVSTLNDAEVVQIQKQIMSAELRKAPAGMDTTTAYIIGIGLGAVLLLVLLIAAAGSSTPYYYY